MSQSRGCLDTGEPCLIMLYGSTNTDTPHASSFRLTSSGTEKDESTVMTVPDNPSALQTFQRVIGERNDARHLYRRKGNEAHESKSPGSSRGQDEIARVQRDRVEKWRETVPLWGSPCTLVCHTGAHTSLK